MAKYHLYLSNTFEGPNIVYINSDTLTSVSMAAVEQTVEQDMEQQQQATTPQQATAQQQHQQRLHSMKVQCAHSIIPPTIVGHKNFQCSKDGKFSCGRCHLVAVCPLPFPLPLRLVAC